VRRGCNHRPEATTIITDFNGEEIAGPDYGNWWVKGTCEYGYCMELNCPVCGCNQGGWGPVGCPCEDWIPWPDMRHQPRPTPVKRSAARYRPSARNRANH
jgi:hypothetical protein